MESEGKLSMMCWNVCKWCKDGSVMDQMREGEVEIGVHGRLEVVSSW